MSLWWCDYPNGRRQVEAPDVDAADTAAMRRWGTYPVAVYPAQESADPSSGGVS